MHKFFLITASLNLFLCVCLDAFGAHTLKHKLSEYSQSIYQTAAEYHFYHSLGLLAIGILILQLPHISAIKWCGYWLIAGILLFSGSLYLLSLTSIRWLGMITPIGGSCFLIAWGMLAYLVWQKY